MTYSYAEDLAKDGQNTTDSIRELLAVMPVFLCTDNIFVEVDLERVIEFGVGAGTFEKLISPRAVIVSNVDLDIIEGMGDVVGVKSKSVNIEITKSGVKNGRTYKKTDKGEALPLKFTDPVSIKKAVAVMQQILTFMVLSNDRIESLNDILSTKEPDLFKEITGITVDLFGHMLDVNFLSRRILERAVQSFMIANLKND